MIQFYRDGILMCLPVLICPLKQSEISFELVHLHFKGYFALIFILFDNAFCFLTMSLVGLQCVIGVFSDNSLHHNYNVASGSEITSCNKID